MQKHEMAKHKRQESSVIVMHGVSKSNNIYLIFIYNQIEWFVLFLRLWLVSPRFNQQLFNWREEKKKSHTRCFFQNLSATVPEHGYNNRLRFVIDSMCMLCKRNKTELKHNI